MSSQPTSLDPYTAKSENTKATPQEKITGKSGYGANTTPISP